jgi:hypothetical protein
MLTEKQIEENKERFELLILANLHPECNLSDYSAIDILEYLSETDFYIAPASTKYHGNYKGGLCEHSLNVYDNLKLIYNTYKHLFDTETISDHTLVLISLLHDVCKINIYKNSFRNVKKLDDKGAEILNEKGLPIWEKIPYYEIEDNYPLGHGEKSVIILQRFYQLITIEIMAIRWHMGGYDDITKSFVGNMTANKAFSMYPIITLLHMADLASIFLTLPKSLSEAAESLSFDKLFYQTEEDLREKTF